MTHGWIGQESFNLSWSKSRNKFFALSAWIALIYAAWRSISWYILRHFECESQSPTGSQNKRFSPALQGPRRFLHWVEGLGAESSGDCLFSMENWRIFWDGIASAACCAPSVGTRNLCHVENRNSACWTKQNTAKGAVCPVSDPAGWRLKEYILSAPWGRTDGKAGMDVLEVGFLWRLGAICLGGRARKSLLYRLKRVLCQRKTVENACQMAVAKKTILC